MKHEAWSKWFCYLGSASFGILFCMMIVNDEPVLYIALTLLAWIGPLVRVGVLSGEICDRKPASGKGFGK